MEKLYIRFHLKPFIILSIGIIYCFAHQALADSPPSYRSMSIQSSNGEYAAQVKSKDGTLENFILTVSKSNGPKLWEVDFIYNGYPGLIYISNDGESVVRINGWDTYRGALFFYQNGQMIKVYKEEEIPFDRSKLRETVPHSNWSMMPLILNKYWIMTLHILDELGYGQIFFKNEQGGMGIKYNKTVLHEISGDDESFYLTTIDGKRHKFNLKTGELVMTDAQWLQNKISEWGY